MERTRVIIADDESLVRLDLREALAELGYLVVGEVSDGQSAVNMARELAPAELEQARQRAFEEWLDGRKASDDVVRSWNSTMVPTAIPTRAPQRR